MPRNLADKTELNKKFNQTDLDIIDKHTFSEIVEGNTAGEVDHDGVELSINGSDIERIF